MVQKIKSIVQLLIQKLLGYPTYLYVFSIYRIWRFQLLKDDADFNYFIDLIHLKKSGTIIDAGANVGYTGVIFAKAFPNFKVLCYEPVAQLNAIIHKVVQFFSIQNIFVKQLALGNSNGIVPIKTPIIEGVKKQGLSYIDIDVKQADEQEPKHFLIEEVQMVSLDADLLDDPDLLPVVGVKVDVENFEFFVLQGSMGLIEKYKPIVMAELWDNERKAACIDLMTRKGYEVKVIENKKLVIYTTQQVLNYFFIPK